MRWRCCEVRSHARTWTELTAVLAALARMPPATLRVAGRYLLGPLVQAGVVSADAPWP